MSRLMRGDFFSYFWLSFFIFFSFDYVFSKELVIGSIK